MIFLSSYIYVFHFIHLLLVDGKAYFCGYGRHASFQDVDPLSKFQPRSVRDRLEIRWIANDSF